MEMVAVMQRAAQQDEESNAARQRVLADVQAENERLRALLLLQQTSASSFSQQAPLTDSYTQT